MENEATPEEQARLDAALEDPDEPLSPGFDTRFFARLREKRQPRRLWRYGLVASLAAAAALVIVMTRPESEDLRDPAELELAMNLDLIDDLDVVAHLDEAEAYEVLAQVDLADLDEGATP